MSASDKKKLRKEMANSAMTPKQKAQQEETRQLRRYTITFAVIMILVVSIIVSAIVIPIFIGIHHRNDHSVTIGGNALSTVDFSYFYMDEVNAYYQDIYKKYYQSYPSMWQLFLLLDVNEPLNEQFFDEEKGITWADHFVDEALHTAQEIYALNAAGQAANFTLTEEEINEMNAYFTYLETQAKNQGYESWNKALETTYGNGANAETYKKYYELNFYASAYQKKYNKDLFESYTGEQIREYEKDKVLNYTSFTYSYYPLVVSDYLKFLYGELESGQSYTEEQKAAALEAAKKDAETLKNCGATTPEKLDEAIKALEINKEKENVSSYLYEDVFYEATGIEEVKAWLALDERKLGDIASIEGKQTTENDDGTTTEVVNRLNVLMFTSRNDNTMPLVNVRHLLVQFQNPTYNSSTGKYEYKQEDKDAAKATAEKYLEEWKKGPMTSDSFAELANKHSADSDGTDGGLYEDVYPGQMVTNFDNWCFDEGRKAGDTGVVETEYGYHVIYYVGTSDLTYRDFMIKNDMLEEQSESWLEEIANGQIAEKIDINGLALDFTFT